MERQHFEPLGADPEGVVKAVDMLLSAERPVIIVGQACVEAPALNCWLAERLQIPVAASASSLGAIDTHHPWRWGCARGSLVSYAAPGRHLAGALAAPDDRTSSS
jgi:acetolactate synthase-1/2/3 large subunit